MSKQPLAGSLAANRVTQMTVQYSLAALSEALGLSYVGDGNVQVSGVATLAAATPNDVAFFANTKYRKYLSTTHAGFVILTPEDQSLYSGNVLLSDNPYYTYACIAKRFSRFHLSHQSQQSPMSRGEDCIIPDSVSIGPNVVIGKRVRLGESVVLGANVILQDDVRIDDDTVLWPNVTVYHDVTIGKRCEVHSGAVIGSDGFGFAPHQGEWHAVAQLGGVRIEDAVSIGANVTIDRGAIDDTHIHTGVKIDNLVQIGHNVVIGAHTVIAGCAGIAGSTKIGRNCQIGGGSGIAGHLRIADQVAVTGMSIITKSITTPGIYSGRDLGQMPFGQWRKRVGFLRHIDKLVKRVKRVEQHLSPATTSTKKQDHSISHDVQQGQQTMSNSLDINQIIQLIPQRYPFLMIDRVLDYELDKSLVAIKNVSINEHFFCGHFPQQPVMPGVLMIEALAQAGAVLAFKTVQELRPEDNAEILYLAGADEVRFKRIVVPGDQLRLEVEVLRSRGRIWKMKARAMVGDELACSAVLLSAK